MIVVSVFAVISTVNSAISFLSYMCARMAKISLMPEIFLKKNKRGAYYVGILLIGTIMIVVNATGLSTSDSLSFMITLAIVFWMVSYVIANCNVLIFRFMIDGVIFLVLAVYAALWCKYKLKKPMFHPIAMHEVMAMENALYLEAHKKQKEDKN